MSRCFMPAEILLPNDNVAMDKWAVIACDQFTSQDEYWSKVEKIVADAPSSLNIVFPEIYLGKDDERIEKIQMTMRKYLEDSTLQVKILSGYVLVERVSEAGKRIGVVGLVDLEHYDFDPSKKTMIRATEGTVISRIPPRMKVRMNASVESPHVMLLIDDDRKQIIEKLYDNRNNLKKVYDMELMMNGGHVKGYAVEGEDAKLLTDEFDKYESQCGGFMFAVGDGNHSLATAKSCWEEIKKQLSPEEIEKHPARYALVEIVNLHSDALVFEPIHRIMFNTNMDKLITYFKEKLSDDSLSLSEGDEVVFIQNGKINSYSIDRRGERLPVDVLQGILDKYLEEHKEAEIDYIHGETDLRELVEKTGGCGILLQSIDKSTLFPAIKAGGVLPRKTFSIGEANEKRYYVECRKICIS